jgi:hypothetical protein
MKPFNKKPKFRFNLLYQYDPDGLHFDFSEKPSATKRNDKPFSTRHHSTHSGSSLWSLKSYSPSSRKTARWSKSEKQVVFCHHSYRITKKLNEKNLEYILRKENGREGKPPVQFGCSEDEYRSNMSERSFRIILSPENQNLDLSVFTSAYISTLEQYTGYSFRWIAAAHYDKAHQHVHILIDGTDRNGKPVRFDNSFMRTTMRDIPRNLATDMLGFRSDEERRSSLVRGCTADRLTPLDRKLASLLKNGSASLYSIKTASSGVLLHKRLIHLISRNLCHYDSESERFIMNPSWQEELKTWGKYGSFLDGLSISGVSKENYRLHIPSRDGSVEGSIITVFYMQVNSTNHAVVIRKHDGSVLYVPLSYMPKNLKTLSHNTRIRVEYTPASGEGTNRIRSTTRIIPNVSHGRSS